ELLGPQDPKKTCITIRDNQRGRKWTTIEYPCARVEEAHPGNGFSRGPRMDRSQLRKADVDALDLEANGFAYFSSCRLSLSSAGQAQSGEGLGEIGRSYGRPGCELMVHPA